MYSYEARVRYSEIDGQDRLKIVSLVNMLQDCATFHSEETGYGLGWLMERHHGWFVTSYQIRIDDLPSMGTELTVTTYPHIVKGMIGERYFTVCDKTTGHMYVRAKSIWVYMDIAEGKPSRIPDDMSEAFGADDLPTDDDWGARKIRQMEDRKSAYDFTVSPLFIDSNHHMNNAYYIEAAREALPEGTDISEIRIEYRSPAQLNDVVHVEIATEEKRTQVFMLAEDGTIYAVVEFTHA